MLTTHTIPSHDPVIRLAPAEPAWQTLARAKKAEQARSIPAEWLVEPAWLSQFEAASDPSVMIKECGVLSEREFELTELVEGNTVGTRLLAREFTALELIRASCKRAAIGHQLVSNPLPSKDQPPPNRS
jgi:amidase